MYFRFSSRSRGNEFDPRIDFFFHFHGSSYIYYLRLYARTAFPFLSCYPLPNSHDLLFFICNCNILRRKLLLLLCYTIFVRPSRKLNSVPRDRQFTHHTNSTLCYLLLHLFRGDTVESANYKFSQLVIHLSILDEIYPQNNKYCHQQGNTGSNLAAVMHRIDMTDAIKQVVWAPGYSIQFNSILFHRQSLGE